MEDCIEGGSCGRILGAMDAPSVRFPLSELFFDMDDTTIALSMRSH